MGIRKCHRTCSWRRVYRQNGFVLALEFYHKHANRSCRNYWHSYVFTSRVSPYNSLRGSPACGLARYNTNSTICQLKKLNSLGTFFIATGVVLFLLGLQLGGVSHPWSSPVVLCCLIFGVASLVIFIFVEWKVAKLPLMPLRLFSQRTQIFVYLVSESLPVLMQWH